MTQPFSLQTIAAALPPALDGIGDYTANLAAELARSGMAVSVLTGQKEARPIPGVTVTRAFDAGIPASTRGLTSYVEAASPDWLFAAI